MRYLFLATMFFCLIFLVSCKSENKEQAAEPSVSPVTTNPFSTNNNNIVPEGVTLNPEHGKPGHRCDLAVGAPLTTPALSNNIPPNVTPAVIPGDAQKVTPNSNNSAVALNPQHGQPGHRCDIAVGAPLNSKPTQ